MYPPALALSADASANSSCKEGFSPMLKCYVNTTEGLKHLRADQDGVVSFEYLIVAACIIAVVSLAFGAGGPLATAMNTAITAISTALTTAVAAG
jgi:Flp pilus assembly pilin Flp